MLSCMKELKITYIIFWKRLHMQTLWTTATDTIELASPCPGDKGEGIIMLFWNTDQGFFGALNFINFSPNPLHTAPSKSHGLLF